MCIYIDMALVVEQTPANSPRSWEWSYDSRMLLLLSKQAGPSLCVGLLPFPQVCVVSGDDAMSLSGDDVQIRRWRHLSKIEQPFSPVRS